jgi:hypothetical protein
MRMIRVKEADVGRSCSRNEGEEQCIQDIGGKAKRRVTTRKT